MDTLTPIVVAAQRGDLAAFNQIVVRFQDMAYATAYAFLNDFHLAQDAAQEAFIDAYLSLPKLREPAAFPGWFRKVVRKHCDRLIRGKQVDTIPLEFSNELTATSGDPAKAAEAKQLRLAAHQAIATLPEDQRLATTLFYVAGYSQKEIATYLEVPVSTVKKRLFTARKQLYERMEITMRGYLQENRPSQNDQFSNAIQIFLALQVNDETMVEGLLKKDPSLINTKCEYHDDLTREMAWWPVGFSPLEWAVSLGRKNLVELLISYQADTNALHTAIFLEQPEMIDLLIAHKADVNLPSFNQQTPLHYAAIRGSNIMTEKLLKAGANREAEDSSGRTPLEWASLNGHLDVVKLLSGNGAGITRLPSAQPDPAQIGPILETGIKVIDLFAPIKRGGRVGLLTPTYGVGQLVVLGEIVYNLIRQRNARAVWVGLEKRRGGAEAVRQCPRKAFIAEQVDVIYGLIDDSPTAQGNLVQQGISWAEDLRSQGHSDVILIIDNSLSTTGQVSALDAMTPITESGAITTILVSFWEEMAIRAKATFDSLDAIVAFDPSRAKQQLYPAISPVKSHVKSGSALIEESNQVIVEQARDLLRQYADLAETLEAKETKELSEHDQTIAIRGARLSRFFSQPFTTAQMFTTTPGKCVTLAQALTDCEAILAGKHDDLAEDAFNYIGTIAEIG